MKIQNLLHICSEHYEQSSEEEKKEQERKAKEAEKKKDGDKKEGETKDADKKEEEKEVDLSLQQMVAVLGLGLIAMGEDIGSEMLFR